MVCDGKQVIGFYSFAASFGGKATPFVARRQEHARTGPGDFARTVRYADGFVVRGANER